MDRKKINIGLLASLIILTILTFVAYEQQGSRGDNIDENQFTLPINTVITSVELKSKDTVVNFDYINNEWMVNDSFKMDPGMRDAFFTVVSSIKIKRPVGVNDRDSIVAFLKGKGIEVKILNKENVLMDYVVGGDEPRSISYYMDPDGDLPYIANLPGYDVYVAGIYSAPEIDWRNRFIFNVDWSNLESLELNYPGDPKSDFTIEYKEDFYYLNDNPTPLDSATVFDYIGELFNFQVEKYINLSSSPVYDSLSKVIPKVRLSIDLIGEESQSLEIFPALEGNKRRLGILNKKEAVLIDPRALAPLFRKKGDW